MKKTISLVLCLIVLLLMGASVLAEKQDKSEIRIAVVMHAMNSSFYTKLADGARAAGEDLGVVVDVSSPPQASSLDEQVNLIENCIAAEYSAIATVTWDPTGFNNVIKKANEANIPVIGFNMAAEGSGVVADIGQDHIDAGYALGKYMFEKVMEGTGKYCVCTCSPADSALLLREEGIAKAAEEFPGVELVQVIDITTDLTAANSAIENAYLADPDIKAFLGVDCFSESIGAFIAANDLTGEVFGGGFDLTEGSLKHIRDGNMQVTIGQNPFMQGYYAVLELYLGLMYGENVMPIDINTGAKLVDASNVDSVQPE